MLPQKKQVKETQETGVLGGASTLPLSLVSGARAALVWLRPDFWADALRLWAYQSFGASAAPLSHVLPVARVLPAGAPPHLPRVHRTGHKRVYHLPSQGKRPETLSTDRAAPV